MIINKEDDYLENDFIKTIMNPTRIRIVQYLATHGKGTAKEMQKILNDIPSASLYRHIKVLSDGGIIEVSDKKQIRGTVEKKYCLCQISASDGESIDYAAVFSGALLSLLVSFGKYFDNPENDPQKDMISFATSALLLSDEEYLEFLKKIAAEINAATGNEPNPERKVRRFTTISSPSEK